MDGGNRLILIDAYSQIFRAFYAIRMLNNSRGEPVNAVYVFIKLLLKLEKLYPCRRGAMLFDCGKVGFRLALAPDYKANRPPMPDALKAQMPLIRSVASAFGWPLLQHEGYEADDLIGAIALAENDSPVHIVSSDKDLSQLIDRRVTMLVPQNGNSGSFEERTVEKVQEKFGVAPELMVDYLALLGDASDNIPGVPGIGPKSAVELLNTYGCAAGWLDEPDKLRDSKFYRKLDGNWDVLRKNRELIRLKTELPEEFSDLDNILIRKDIDWAAVRAICVDNQFNSILKELPEPEEAQVPEEDFPEMELPLFARKAPEVPEKTVEPENSSGGESSKPFQMELF